MEKMDKGTMLLGTEEAKVLSQPTVSRPFWGGRTPRYICQMFMAKDACIEIEGGVYRVNQVAEPFLELGQTVQKSPEALPFGNLKPKASHNEGEVIDVSFAKYKSDPLELKLIPIQSVVKVHTRIPDLYSNKHDQLLHQLQLSAETIYETKENLIYNHPVFGLLNQVKDKLRIKTEAKPTPNLLDQMLTKLWKMPDAFFMHMDTLQALQAECNKLGIALETKEMFGSSFSCWRGLPLFPTNKLHLLGTGKTDDETGREKLKTSICLVRFGEKKQGCISLFPKEKKGSEALPLIDCEFMGIDNNSVASYLLTTYTAIAVLTPGALCVSDVVI